MTIQSISINERLGQSLKDARDWERKATSIPGLFVLKLTGLRGNLPSVVIEVNLLTLQVHLLKREELSYDLLQSYNGSKTYYLIPR